jgi:hypothetical protein
VASPVVSLTSTVGYNGIVASTVLNLTTYAVSEKKVQRNCFEVMILVQELKSATQQVLKKDIKSGKKPVF